MSVDVALVVPPFADIERPALGVSLLAAILADAGFSATVLYPNLRWAERVGVPLYNWIADRGDPDGPADTTVAESLVAEWVFADLASDVPSDPVAYCARFFHGRHAARVPQLLASRAQRAGFLDEVVARLVEKAPRIVGFTTTLASLTAGLAIAKRLRSLPNPPILVFGGSACEGPMGAALAASFDVDWVCTGEGDRAFPALVAAILAGAEPDVPGMIPGRRPGVRPRSAAPAELDALPIPDFSSWFDAVAASPLREGLSPRLPVETSRGCWWGQKRHCTFCGLNGATMTFRSKSPARAVAEFRALRDRWGVHAVDTVDNIVDNRYFESVFPALVDDGLSLFYETKSNLRRDQVAVLARAGVHAIQPGIESLDTGTLERMRKGTTAGQNIALLRWCAAEGVNVAWNILFGFPDEDLASLDRTAAIVPLLEHLPPPSLAGRIRLSRFSPLFEQRLGVTDVRPTEAWAHIFALPAPAQTDLCFYFDFAYADGRDPVAAGRGLTDAVARWTDPSRPPARLDARVVGDKVFVRDTRAVAERGLHVLTGPLAQTLLACDAPRSAAAIARTLGADEAVVCEWLTTLEARRLVLAVDGRWVALPCLPLLEVDRRVRPVAEGLVV